MKYLPLIWIVAGMVATGAFTQEPLPEPKRDRPALTDDQKMLQEQRANDAWNKLSPEAKVRVLRLHTALNQMPVEERKFIHDRVERFLNMSPEERAQIRQNADRWKSMSPEQREQAREQFRQHRKEFETKWRQEHPSEEPPPFPLRGHQPAPTDSANPEPKPQENP